MASTPIRRLAALTYVQPLPYAARHSLPARPAAPTLRRDAASVRVRLRRAVEEGELQRDFALNPFRVYESRCNRVERFRKSDRIKDGDRLLISTAGGIVIRMPIDDTIRQIGRNTQGVRLIRLEDNDAVRATQLVPPSVGTIGRR